MNRGYRARACRLAGVLMAGVSLAACASLTTPRYAVRDGSLSPSGGSTVRPPAHAGAHGTNAPYQVGGIWYVPREQPRYDQTGIASWYGDAFHLKATATGEIFDMNQVSAAHTTLPLPSMVEVTNLDNGRRMTLRVNDRGPFVGGRIIDLSRAAAQELGYDRAGTAHVRVRYVGPAPLAGPAAGVRYARADPLPPRAVSRLARRPADEEIFDDYAITPAPAPVSVRPLVAPPEAVSVAPLPALPSAVKSSRDAAPAGVFRDAYVSDVVARRSAPATSPMATVSNDPVVTEPASPYRIQAGAFSDEDNAKRAAARLGAAGTATVEPFDRSGVTFYRVFLPGPADEAQAYVVRDKVAAIGFADARVVRP